MDRQTEVRAAVEGTVDTAIFERLVVHVGGVPGPVFGQKGRDDVLKKLQGFNLAAQRQPWLVLADLDDDACAAKFVARHLPDPAPFMSFRIAVREAEAWVLADRSGVAAWLGVSERHVPADLESIADPKEALVNLARRSRKPRLRGDIVPRPESKRAVGAGYNAAVPDFVRTRWDIEAAAAMSDSLRRAVDDMRHVLAAYDASLET